MLYKNKVIALAQKPEPVVCLTNEVKALLFILTTLAVSKPNFRENLPIVTLRVLLNRRWINDPRLFLIMFGLERLPNFLKKVIAGTSTSLLLYDLYSQVSKTNQNNFPKNK